MQDGVETAGVTKEPTGRKPLKMKGHTRLHREVQELRNARKLVFHLSDPLPEGNQTQLTDLKSNLHSILSKGPLESFCSENPLLTLETFLQETALLVKTRLALIDKELADVKQANIKEMISKLQSRYGEAGSKMMKRIMGKMGVAQDLWGIDTDYPDTIKISSIHIPPQVHEWIREGKVSVHTEHSTTWITSLSLAHVHPLAKLCFDTYPEGTVEIQQAVRRLVTTASDKLCAEEKFFGENAMSKQAHCSRCKNTRLQTLTKVDSTSRTQGFICPWDTGANPLTQLETSSKIPMALQSTPLEQFPLPLTRFEEPLRAQTLFTSSIL